MLSWSVTQFSYCSFAVTAVEVNCGPPIDALYEFSGSLISVTRYTVPQRPRLNQEVSSSVRMTDRIHRHRYHPNPSDETEILKGQYPLDLGQFILRGTSLVNTSWVYGLVVYVSTDTRIFQNANTKVS